MKFIHTMRSIKPRTYGLLSLAVPVIAVAAGSPLLANAMSTTTTTSTDTSQSRLPVIISKGDQEITRRLTTLGTLSSKISAATKLTASDKTSLTNEVSATISGLTTLKAQLDSETTVAAAKTDVANIYSEYRVYALVAPKVGLIKVADDQQVVEAKLTALSTKLQARITADQTAGKNVTTLQADLTDLNTKVSASQAISANMETSVIGLEPSDYNSDHALLTGDSTQLKTAHADNVAAATDAKNIIAGLKSL
jgi:hypothetical protein